MGMSESVALCGGDVASPAGCPPQRSRCSLAEPAAVLAGVALHGPLAVLSILPQAERDDRAVLLERVRTLLGRTAYERAVAQGAAMNDDEAITYALDQIDTAETQSLAQSAAPDVQRPTAKGTSSARHSAKRSRAKRR